MSSSSIFAINELLSLGLLSLDCCVLALCVFVGEVVELLALTLRPVGQVFHCFEVDH